MGSEIDEAYMKRLTTLPLDPELIRAQGSFKVVFSALHGVGGVIIKPMLDRLGFHCQTVPEQDVPDGRFPTVKSPNPENAEALTMAMKLADEGGGERPLRRQPGVTLVPRNRDFAGPCGEGQQAAVWPRAQAPRPVGLSLRPMDGGDSTAKGER